MMSVLSQTVGHRNHSPPNLMYDIPLEQQPLLRPALYFPCRFLQSCHQLINKKKIKNKNNDDEKITLTRNTCKPL